MMKALAKAGFTQSYTYFTWRNTKQELIDYLSEITTPPVAEYFRGHLWPNTPDILHESLQRGGRPAFKTRLALAATLSSLYGIYAGYELCENVPREPASEEYLNSEKYEYKVRAWDAPGNLVDYVTRINRIRTRTARYTLPESPVLRRGRSEHPLLRQDDARARQSRLRGRQPRPLRHPRVPGRRADRRARDRRGADLPDARADQRPVARVAGARGYVELDPHIEPAQIFVLHR